MKFVHIADTHFDTPFTNLSSKNNFGKMRRVEQREALKKIIQYIQENKIPYLFISGDFYEHEYIKKSTIEYINQLFQKIPQTQIFITPGNHDPYIKNSMYYHFEWSGNVKIFTSKIEKVETPEADIYGLGFEDFYHSGIDLEHLIIEDKNKINIFITHGSLNAGETDLQYNPINKNKLKQLGFDYVALGHIHKLDYNSEANQRIVYPGSTISMGFDELGQHGFITGELTKETLDLKFIPVDTKEFVELEMNITEINDFEELIQTLNHMPLDEDKFYKIILTGKRKFEIDILEVMKCIKKENIIKIKNRTEPDYDIEKMVNETTLKGIFIKQLLDEKNNYTEEEFQQILEIGLSIMDKEKRKSRIENKETLVKIKNIKINAYGTLKEKEISLENHLNIIYGKNESGKSTLLNYIKNIFYGISKNKNGKEISDYEKYKPWTGDEFSGKISYQLDDGKNYEIYRDFTKKNAKLFDDNLEEISSQYKIDKKDGSQFFYDQTNVDEKMYLSTIMAPQQEVVLDHATQNVLVQKIANLAGTGEDTVSFQKAMDKLNKRLVEEVGTSRTQDRPLKLITKRMKEIETLLKDEMNYLTNKRDLDGNKEELLEKLATEKGKSEILKDIITTMRKEQINQEKNELKNQLQNEKKEKIKNLKLEKENLIKNKEQDLQENLEQPEKKEEEKLNKKIKKNNIAFLGVFIVLILINLLSFLATQNQIIRSITLLFIPITFTFFFMNITKNHKKKKEIQNKLVENKLQAKLQQQKMEEQISAIDNQIHLLETELQKQQGEIEEERKNIYANMQSAIEKWKVQNPNLEILQSTTHLPTEEELQKALEISEQQMMEYCLQLNKLEYEDKNVSEKLEEVVLLKEEYEDLKEQLQIVEEKNKCIQITKELLEKAYEQMKQNVTPKFTQNLSKLIQEVTDGKYQKVSIHEEKGLIVELKSGEYVSANLLSIGTIDQLYLSLRLAMLDEISQEKMPIILDEAFAYFDEERLKNSLQFLAEQAKEHQILLFTCTKREKDILETLKLPYHWIDIS